MSDLDEDAVLSDVEGEEEAHQERVGEGEKTKVCSLTPDTISQGLSLLSRVGTGLGHAFIRLDLKDNGLNEIDAISNYIHIRFLDLSNNHLTDLSPLASLTQLLWLKVDNNVVVSFEGQPFTHLPYLQWLSMAGNQLTDVVGLVGPALESLNLTGNNIQRMNGFQGGLYANLVTLELRGNQLDTTDGISLPNLQHLYLAQNAIKHLKGLETLERLTTLHLRDNQLETLEGLNSNMKCLQYLNVRGNAISDQKALRSLSNVSKTLKALVLLDNPLVEMTDYRLSVLICLPHLERLDKDPVSYEQRAEALEGIEELKEEEIPGLKDLQ